MAKSILQEVATFNAEQFNTAKMKNEVQDLEHKFDEVSEQLDEKLISSTSTNYNNILNNTNTITDFVKNIEIDTMQLAVEVGSLEDFTLMHLAKIYKNSGHVDKKIHRAIESRKNADDLFALKRLDHFTGPVKTPTLNEDTQDITYSDEIDSESKSWIYVEDDAIKRSGHDVVSLNYNTKTVIIGNIDTNGAIPPVPNGYRNVYMPGDAKIEENLDINNGQLTIVSDSADTYSISTTNDIITPQMAKIDSGIEIKTGSVDILTNGNFTTTEGDIYTTEGDVYTTKGDIFNEEGNAYLKDGSLWIGSDTLVPNDVLQESIDKYNGIAINNPTGIEMFSSGGHLYTSKTLTVGTDVSVHGLTILDNRLTAKANIEGQSEFTIVNVDNTTTPSTTTETFKIDNTGATEAQSLIIRDTLETRGKTKLQDDVEIGTENSDPLKVLDVYSTSNFKEDSIFEKNTTTEGLVKIEGGLEVTDKIAEFKSSIYISDSLNSSTPYLQVDGESKFKGNMNIYDSSLSMYKSVTTSGISSNVKKLEIESDGTITAQSGIIIESGTSEFRNIEIKNDDDTTIEFTTAGVIEVSGTNGYLEVSGTNGYLEVSGTNGYIEAKSHITTKSYEISGTEVIDEDETFVGSGGVSVSADVSAEEYFIGTDKVIDSSKKFVGVGGVETTGNIKTTGATSYIDVSGANGYIEASGANGYIEASGANGYIEASTYVKADSYKIGNTTVINSSGNFIANDVALSSGDIYTSSGDIYTSTGDFKIGTSKVINSSKEFVGTGGVDTSGTITTSSNIISTGTGKLKGVIDSTSGTITTLSSTTISTSTLSATGNVSADSYKIGTSNVINSSKQFIGSGGINTSGSVSGGSISGTGLNISGNGTFEGYTVTADTFKGKATSAQYSDLAEKYLSDSVLEKGTVVQISRTGVHDIEEFKNGSYCGVVTTAPGLMMNISEQTSDEKWLLIALTGRVPVKVSCDVKKGDLIIADRHNAGFARVGDTRMCEDFIGFALEDCIEGAKVLVKM